MSKGSFGSIPAPMASISRAAAGKRHASSKCSKRTSRFQWCTLRSARHGKFTSVSACAKPHRVSAGCLRSCHSKPPDRQSRAILGELQNREGVSNDADDRQIERRGFCGLDHPKRRACGPLGTGGRIFCGQADFSFHRDDSGRWIRSLCAHAGSPHPSSHPRSSVDHSEEYARSGWADVGHYLYNRAPSDGSKLATVQNGLPFEKLFQTLSTEAKNALFDATKFGWIGSIMQTVFVTVTWHASGVKTLQDATMREVVLGASATSSDSYVLAMLSNSLLGTKFKVVHGYAGAAEVDLAVENGEVQGEAGKDWTTLTSTRPQWISGKKINILVQMGLKAHPDLKAVPMAIELARTPEDRRIMEVVFAKFGMSRPFLTPPGIAPKQLEVLRRAFEATMNDPAFRAEAEKLGMEIDPVSGENVQTLVSRILATPADLAQRAREVLRPR